MRARLALAASGVRCELREVVLRDKPQALLQASPKGTVPVLVLPDGKVLEQSLDIMLWALRRHDPMHWLAPAGVGLEHMLALIAENDGAFKRHLDCYKYPQRQEPLAGEGPDFHRAQGAAWLLGLERRLASAVCLFGDHPSLADMALAPFVRQFAGVDAEWFDAQPWPHLRRWLSDWLASPLFARVMNKYTPWKPGGAPVFFPGS